MRLQLKTTLLEALDLNKDGQNLLKQILEDNTPITVEAMFYLPRKGLTSAQKQRLKQGVKVLKEANMIKCLDERNFKYILNPEKFNIHNEFAYLFWRLGTETIDTLENLLKFVAVINRKEHRTKNIVEAGMKQFTDLDNLLNVIESACLEKDEFVIDNEGFCKQFDEWVPANIDEKTYDPCINCPCNVNYVYRKKQYNICTVEGIDMYRIYNNSKLCQEMKPHWFV